MKKSERYHLAMIAVVDNERIEAADKLEVLATLMQDKSVAEWSERNEKQEEEKKAEEAQ